MIKKFDADLSQFKSSDFTDVYEPGSCYSCTSFHVHVAEDSYLLSDAVIFDADFLNCTLPEAPLCVELGNKSFCSSCLILSRDWKRRCNDQHFQIFILYKQKTCLLCNGYQSCGSQTVL